MQLVRSNNQSPKRVVFYAPPGSVRVNKYMNVCFQFLEIISWSISIYGLNLWVLVKESYRALEYMVKLSAAFKYTDAGHKCI